jgi:hypothetical protein
LRQYQAVASRVNAKECVQVRKLQHLAARHALGGDQARALTNAL